MEYENPKLAVDGAVIQGNKILLIKRGNEPFKDMWALPGGFMDVGETTEDATLREVKEETSLDVKIEKLVGVYSDPDRDPRHHTVSVIYLCSIISGETKAGDDAMEAKWFPLDELPELAFDHNQVLEDVVRLVE